MAHLVGIVTEEGIHERWSALDPIEWIWFLPKPDPTNPNRREESALRFTEFPLPLQRAMFHRIVQQN